MYKPGAKRGHPPKNDRMPTPKGTMPCEFILVEIQNCTHAHLLSRTHTHTPVSYAHLDVYKRQCPSRATCSVAGSFSAVVLAYTSAVYTLSLIHI